MREMRLFKRKVKEPERLREIVEKCEVVRIGAVDEEGMFIVPVNFGYEMTEEKPGDKPMLRLYFHSAREGRKAEAFAGNPRVAVEMDCDHQLIQGDYTCSYSYAYTSIMGNGNITLLTHREEKIHGLKVLMEHLGASEELVFDEGMLERVNVYRIDVDTYTGKMRTPK